MYLCAIRDILRAIYNERMRTKCIQSRLIAGIIKLISNRFASAIFIIMRYGKRERFYRYKISKGREKGQLEPERLNYYDNRSQ